MDSTLDKETMRHMMRQRAEALEEAETADLLSLTNAEAVRRIKSLRTFEKPWRQDSDWSGLVDWSRMFHRRSEA